MLIDSHAHLLDERLVESIPEILAQYPINDIELSIEIGADMSSSKGAVLLAEKYDNIYATVGLHPEFAERATDNDIEELRLLAQNDKVVAIGDGTTFDGKDVGMKVAVGDDVLFSKYAGTEIEFEGKKYVIVRQADILAKLK